MLKNYTRQLFAQLSRHLPRRLVQRDPLPDARHLASGPIPESLGQHCLNVAAMDDQRSGAPLTATLKGSMKAKWRRKFSNMVTTRSRRRSPPVVGASVDLLSQPVQPAADGARHRLLFHRGSVRRRGYRPDGGDLDIAQFHPGGALDQSGGCAEGDGEQHRHRAAGGERAGESRWLELPIDQLVPGDIVRLSAGI